MSVEAIAYVKSRDLGECEKARLLLYVIGENTFNDTFICVLGQDQLAYEAGRISDRTVRRYIDDLVAARLLLRKDRFRKGGGRQKDALRLVGFKRWYFANYGASKRAFRSKSKPDNLAALPPEQTGQSVRIKPDSTCPVYTGQQVSGINKDTRTSPVKREGARAGAPSEDFKFDLEGKGVRDRLLAKLGAEVFRSWFADVIFRQFDATTAVAETNLKFKRDWLRSHYERVILDACRAEYGADIARVEFVWLSRKGIAA